MSTLGNEHCCTLQTRVTPLQAFPVFNGSFSENNSVEYARWGVRVAGFPRLAGCGSALARLRFRLTARLPRLLALGLYL